MNYSKCGFLCFAIIFLFRNVDGLSCYQCSTDGKAICDNSKLGNIVSEPCPADDNNFCVFLDITAPDTRIVRRFCSNVEVKDCSQFTKTFTSSNCRLHSCNTDGCNTGSFATMNIMMLFVGLLVSYSFLIE